MLREQARVQFADGVIWQLEHGNVRLDLMQAESPPIDVMIGLYAQFGVVMRAATFGTIVRGALLEEKDAVRQTGQRNCT
ncbi:MAG: hypothetical protein ACOC0E_12290 [Spirochaetota bacterium]